MLIKIAIVALFTFACVAVDCGAQSQADYDSLTQRILKMDAAINTIHLNMVKSQNEFRTGTFLIIAGTVLTIAGALIKTDKAGTAMGNNNSAFLYIGAGISTIGAIVQIDSHKWIGRGARRAKRGASLK